MKSQKARFLAAYCAMKELGIPKNTTKQALKKLLKLYDKSWVLIEHENYRVLADAIFGDDGQQEDQYTTIETQENAPIEIASDESDLEQPCKRLKNDEALSKEPVELYVVDGSSMRDPSPEPNDETKIPLDPLQMTASASHSLYLTNKEGNKEEPGVVVAAEEGSKPADDAEFSIKSNNDRSTTDEIPGIDDTPPAEVYPEPLPHIGSSVTSDSNSSNRDAQNVDRERAENPSSPTTAKRIPMTFDIATSSHGEVKLSLSYNPVHDRPNVEVLSTDSLMEYMEHKCSAMYKNVGPDFSVTKMMRNFCECFLELATTSSSSMLAEKQISGDENNNSQNLASMVKNELICDDMRRTYDAINLTCNEENVEVAIMMTRSLAQELPAFTYISQSPVYKKAQLTLSLADDRVCCPKCRVADCLWSTNECVCAHRNGGSFHYTVEGLLTETFLAESCMNKDMTLLCNPHQLFYCRECPLEKCKSSDLIEPCSGHLKGKFIKECWVNCACSNNCRNRLVQRGITHKLQVFWTLEGKGWGLRTLEDLPKGAFVCEYVGEIMTLTELLERQQQTNSSRKHSYSVVLDAGWGSCSLNDDQTLCLDATFYGNVARFINHRCFDANLVEIPVQMETPDGHYYHVALFTKRKICAMEELTWDYRNNIDKGNTFFQASPCLCGSIFCRNMTISES